MARAVKNYQVRRGEQWDRLIIPRDKRTHAHRHPIQAEACVLIGDVKYIIPNTITSEGGVWLSLLPANTAWLETGEYPWDLVMTVSRSAVLLAEPVAETLAVSGTLTVEDNGNITPMASDTLSTPLEAVVA